MSAGCANGLGMGRELTPGVQGVNLAPGQSTGGVCHCLLKRGQNPHYWEDADDYTEGLHVPKEALWIMLRLAYIQFKQTTQARDRQQPF